MDQLEKQQPATEIHVDFWRPKSFQVKNGMDEHRDYNQSVAGSITVKFLRIPQ